MNFIQELRDAKEPHRIGAALGQLIPLSASDAQVRKEICHSGVVKDLIDLLGAQPALKARALILLMNLTKDEAEGIKQLRELGGLAKCIEIAKAGQDYNMIEYSVGVILNCGKDEETANYIREHGGITDIVNHLKQAKQLPPSLVLNLVTAIAIMTSFESGTNRNVVFNAGGVRALVDLLKQTPESEVNLLVIIIRALRGLVVDDDIALEVARAGITNLVFQLAQSKDNRLQSGATYLLQMLPSVQATDGEASESPAPSEGSPSAGAREAAHASGAIQHLDTIIEQLNSTDEESLLRAMKLLLAFSGDEANRAYFREKKVLQRVVSLVRTAEFGETREMAAHILDDFAEDKEGAFSMISRDVDAPAGLVRLLQIPDFPELHYVACSVISTLSKYPEARERFREVGLYNVVSQFLQKGEMVYAIANVLVNYADNPITRKELRDTGLLELLGGLLEHKDPAVQRSVAAVLWNSVNDDDNMKLADERRWLYKMAVLLPVTDLDSTNPLTRERKRMKQSERFEIIRGDQLKRSSMKSKLELFSEEPRVVELETIPEPQEEYVPYDYGAAEEEEQRQKEEQAKRKDEEGRTEEPAIRFEEEEPVETLEPEQVEEDTLVGDGDMTEERRKRIEAKRQEWLARKKIHDEEVARKKAERDERRRKKAELKAKEEEEKRKKAQQRKEQRKRIARELLETEKAYVLSLRSARDNYIVPIQKTKGILDNDKFDKIFGDLEVVLMVNENFYHELQKLWAVPGALDGNEEEMVGSLFVKRAATFKLYCNYINKYDAAIAAIAEAKQQSKKFAELCEKVTEKLEAENSRQTDLEAFLIQPVQRLPRYSLLLRDLLKYSDHPADAPAYIMLQTACELVGEITAYCNEKKREFESRDKTARYQKEFNIKDFNPSRGFVKEQTNHVSVAVPSSKNKKDHEKSEGRIILFTDMLVCTKQIGARSKSTFKFKLADITAEDASADVDPENKTLAINCSRVTADAPAQLYISFDLPKDKTSWIQVINETIEEHRKNRAGHAPPQAEPEKKRISVFFGRK